MVQEPLSGLVLPEDIQPIPRAKTRTSNRGRKSTTAKAITSSPYKNQLSESLTFAKSRTRRRGRGHLRGRRRDCSLGRSQDGEGSSSINSESDAVEDNDYEYEEHAYSFSIYLRFLLLVLIQLIHTFIMALRVPYNQHLISYLIFFKIHKF